MARISEYLKLTREESPVAFIVLPIAAFVFLATTLGYVALTIATC